MRKLYWYLSAYFKKHGWLFAVSVVIALVVFSFSIPVIVQKLEQKPRRYIGVVGDYALNNLPRLIEDQMSAGLTQLELDDTVSPHLAERWIVEDEGKTYRFVIKKGVFWQDGKELQTQDIEYLFRDVEIITTPNDVVFKLPDAFVPFPAVVSQPVFRTVEETHNFFIKRPMLIGLGEYRLVDYKRQGQKLKEIVLDGPTERLIYRFYLTEDEAITGFKVGEVDTLSNLSSPRDLADWPNVGITNSLHPDRYLAVFFNNAHPFLSRNIRQALSYAVTKPIDETRALGPINPLSWAYLEGGKTYDKDMARAVERLLETIPGEPLTLELTTTNIFTTEAETIKQEWESLGQTAFESCQSSTDIKDKSLCENLKISVKLHITNFPDTGNFQTLLIGQQIPADPDQYALWHSDQSTNFTNYKNTRIDALLEKGRTTPELTERRAIYQEFQQFFLEDAPAIFIRHLESYTIQRQ